MSESKSTKNCVLSKHKLEESKDSKLDDALEIRKAACEELRRKNN